MIKLYSYSNDTQGYVNTVAVAVEENQQINVRVDVIHLLYLLTVYVCLCESDIHNDTNYPLVAVMPAFVIREHVGSAM